MTSPLLLPLPFYLPSRSSVMADFDDSCRTTYNRVHIWWFGVAQADVRVWLCDAGTSKWASMVIRRGHEWMCLYGELAWTRVYVLIQYFGTCASTSNIDVFRFALERIINCNNETSWLLRLSRRHVRKTLLEILSRSSVAPHTHYWQPTGCSDTTVGLVLSEGDGGTWWITTKLGAYVCVIGCAPGGR